MSILDAIATKVLNFLNHIGLYNKKDENLSLNDNDSSPAAKFNVEKKKKTEPFPEYTNVPLSIRKEIDAESLSTKKHSSKCDLIINLLIENKKHLIGIIIGDFRLQFEFDNGTKLSFWIENLWYAFMTSIVIENKNSKKSELNDVQPSKETMVKFLDAFHDVFRIENRHITAPQEIVENWFIDDYFVFNDNEEKNDEENKDGQESR